MKTKSILSVPIYILFLILFITLYSCKDNPVNSGEAYDSPRFDWQVTMLPDGEWIYDLWSPDTNEVFMTSWNNHLLYFMDGQITQMNYGTNIKIACIDGINKNEGYIAGSEVKNGKYTPHIERWNGSSFSNVPINYNFNDEFYVSHLLVKSSNEIWISSPKGLIYNFDGYNLTQYRLPDTNLISLDLLPGENGRIQYVSVDFDSVIFNDINYVYEFDGNNWSKVYEAKGYKFYGVLNSMIYAIYDKTIYKLQNNILIEKVYIPEKAGVDVIAGNSFENIMGFGRANGRTAFLHWNGQKWSDEKIGDEFISDILTRKMVNDNYFCAVNSGFVDFPVLYRAYKKH
ncbi:MAG: hypothetical protein WC358_11080 [Ignavibacteria bacterium]|jgi:hypothetical protein